MDSFSSSMIYLLFSLLGMLIVILSSRIPKTPTFVNTIEELNKCIEKIERKKKWSKTGLFIVFLAFIFQVINIFI